MGRSGGDLEPLAQLRGSIYGAAWSPEGSLAVVGVDEKQTPEWANPLLFVIEDGKPRRLGVELDLPVANMTYGDLVVPTHGSRFNGWTKII